MVGQNNLGLIISSGRAMLGQIKCLTHYFVGKSNVSDRITSDLLFRPKEQCSDKRTSASLFRPEDQCSDKITLDLLFRPEEQCWTK